MKSKIFKNPFIESGIIEVIHLIEKKTGKVFNDRLQNFQYRLPVLKEPGEICDMLKKAGVISFSLNRYGSFHDEPRFYRSVAGDSSNMRSGGASFESSAVAMYKALAEGLERHLWMRVDDYFDNPKKLSLKDAGNNIVSPEHFVGFSDDTLNRPECKFSDDSLFLWIEAESLTSCKKKLVPAQIVSAKYGHGTHETGPKYTEPIIRMPITTGLATAPSRERAILRGALEVIERDAFMITWLNKLSMPRIILKEMAEKNEAIKKLVDQCVRYNLIPHAILLCTDAPVYVVSGVIEDKSGGPAFTMGARASFSIEEAVEDSLSEALSVRTSIRNGNEKIPDDTKDFKRDDRIWYWSKPENQEGVKFFISGQKQSMVFNDTSMSDKEKLKCIVSWCKSKSYELFTVNIGKSVNNPTDWHVYFTCIPEMQPMHLAERYPYFSGPRLKSVPKTLGYEPAKEINTEPHPFP